MSSAPEASGPVPEIVVSAPPRPRLGAERVVGIALALTVLTVDTLAMPRLFAAGDSNAWLEEAASLLREGTLAVPQTAVYALQDATESGQYFVRNAADGRWYSKYGLMNTAMFLPPMAVSWALGRYVPAPGAQVDVLVFNIYYVALAVVTCLLLFRVTREYSARPLVRAAYVLACFYGTCLWFYQRAQYSELYQVLFFAAAFHFLVRLARGATRVEGIDRMALVGAWLAIGALALTRVVYVFLLPLPFVALVAAGGIRKRFGPWSLRGLVPFLVVPPLLIVVLFGAINAAKFGAPWLSGYHQWDRVQGLDGEWRHGLVGFIVSVRWSVLLHFPPLAFSILAAREFARRHRPDAIVMYVALAAVLAFVAKMGSWRGEWSYGPRYLLFALPIVSLPFLTLLDRIVDQRSRARQCLAGALTAAVLAYTATLEAHVARLDFWAWYDLRLPLRGVTSDLVAKYFYEQPEGEIRRDLLAHRDDLDSSSLMRAVRAEAPPDFADWYRGVASKVVRNANWYWWTPDGR